MILQWFVLEMEYFKAMEADQSAVIHAASLRIACQKFVSDCGANVMAFTHCG